MGGQRVAQRCINWQVSLFLRGKTAKRDMPVKPSRVFSQQMCQLCAGQTALIIGAQGGNPPQRNRTVAGRQLSGTVEQRNGGIAGLKRGAGKTVRDQRVGRCQRSGFCKGGMCPGAVLQLAPRQPQELPKSSILGCAVQGGDKHPFHGCSKALFQALCSGTHNGDRVRKGGTIECLKRSGTD